MDMYMYMYMHMDMDMYVYIHRNVYVYVSVYAHLHVYVNKTLLNVNLYVRLYVDLGAHTFMCAYVRIDADSSSWGTSNIFKTE